MQKFDPLTREGLRFGVGKSPRSLHVLDPALAHPWQILAGVPNRFRCDMLKLGQWRMRLVTHEGIDLLSTRSVAVAAAVQTLVRPDRLALASRYHG